MMKVTSLCEESQEATSVMFNEKTREIFLAGEINDVVFNNIIFALRVLDRKKGNITLYINTQGGQAGAGFGLYDAIAMCQNKVIGICIGECMSAGILVILGCDGRLATPECRFMIHEIQQGLPIMPNDRVGRYYKEGKTLTDRFRELLVRDTELTKTEATKLCGADNFISADQALEYGLIDGIFEYNKIRKAKKGKK